LEINSGDTCRINESFSSLIHDVSRSHTTTHQSR
jgi:hypothetical protein